MLKIYIARHGQDEDNKEGILNGRRDNSLTEKGVKQAEAVGQKIADAEIKFDKIYCSPLKRASETAGIISGIIGGSDPVVMEHLIEREFGVMTGKKHSDIVSMCSPNILQSFKTTYFLEPEGAETFPQLLERAKMIIAKLQEENETGNVLVVTHGDIGKMIYADFYGLGWKEALEKFDFANAELLLLSEESSVDDVHVF